MPPASVVTKVVTKVVGIALAVAAGLALLGVGVVYVRSEQRLREYQAVPRFELAIPSDPASIARGEHIARTRGCLSCHGQQLEGTDFSEEWPESGTPVAPNLARLTRAEDAATIEAAIRHGIGHDGRALWSMPAYNFRHLRDDDLAALIAYLRSRPVVEKALPVPWHSWTVRWDLAFGGGTHMPEWVAGVPPLRMDPARDSLLAAGEYIAMTACNECHGLDLRGSDDRPPDLAIVAGYSREEFGHLLHDGVARDGRTELGLMSGVARGRYAYLRDDEVSAVYQYLRTLAGQPVPTGVFWRGSSATP